MTTQSWATRVRHDSDATFREWGAELATKLDAAGLVQTSDTGQINWTTVTRPGTSTAAGYEIRRFNDSLQATAPIFLRVEYGTGSSATAPRIRVTVGTGTNGAGTLTGTALTTVREIHGSSAQASDTLRNSYACHAEGFFGLSWKQGASNTEALLLISRSCDSDGDPDAVAAIVVWGAGSQSALTATQGLRFAATAAAYTAATSAVNSMLGFNPQAQASSLVGSDIQIFLGWMITPQVKPIFSTCGVLDAESAAGNTFSIVLVGTTSRTYLSLTNASGPFGPGNAGGSGMPKFAMLWE